MERCGDGNNGGEEGRWQLVGVRLLLAGGWEFEIDFDQQSGPVVDFQPQIDFLGSTKCSNAPLKKRNRNRQRPRFPKNERG